MPIAKHARRRGVAAIEFAFVAPVVFVLIYAQIVGSMGVSRYQEVAHLAREGARYASTHGGMYQREGVAERTGVPAVDGSEELRRYLVGKTALLDPNRLKIDVDWTAPDTLNPVNMPTYVNSEPSPVPAQQVVQNYITVTVTYRWFPEVFPMQVMTLESTSRMPMSY